MSTANDIPEERDEEATVGAQPVAGRDTTIEQDPAAVPAQAEWEMTQRRDEGDPDVLDPSPAATGDDPDQIPGDIDQIPVDDLPGRAGQPDSQGEDPVVAELGEEGEGDIGPADL